MTAITGVTVGQGATPPPPPAQRRRRRGVAYLLLLPGGLWLAVFFVLPMAGLASTSLYDPSGSLEFGYQMTWEWRNYADALSTYWPQFSRSFGTPASPRCSRCCSGTRWRT
jgi:ABC-type spermidine/putrescine transport system, permease component I